MLGRFAFSPFLCVEFPPTKRNKNNTKNRERATAISELEQAKIDQFSSCILCVHKTHTHVRPVRRTIMIECFLPIEKSKTEEEDLKLVRAPQSKDLIIVNHASRAEQEENWVKIENVVANETVSLSNL